MNRFFLILGVIVLTFSQCKMKKGTSNLTSLSQYKADDLGLTFKNGIPVIKLYSPTAVDVKLNLYDNSETTPTLRAIEVKKDNYGIWTAQLLPSDIEKYYTWQIKTEEAWLAETVDPYTKLVSVNGKRGYIEDVTAIKPAGWENESYIETSPNDAVIYELHVRDFSISQNSGLQHKGKFLAFTETGSTNEQGDKTGLDYIKGLGVTHIHLLPFFDYASIDEAGDLNTQYNWGYDPQNYNVPEGSYATDIRKPETRVFELKQAIQAIHKQGIGVVMDVVYNHTSSKNDSPFDLTYPGGYYRKDKTGNFTDASGCGNETASETAHFRKFMIESLKYWAQEYKIDGFRFDLMGIHDIEIMNQIAIELRNINPNVLLYGEGWTAAQSPLPDSLRALKKNTYKLLDVAAFSDDFRDGIKGSVFDEEAPGFANGGEGFEENVKFGIIGNIAHPQVDMKKVHYSQKPWANEPFQSINYVSCHDNLTLFDKLYATNIEASEKEVLQMQKLALGLVLTSQGIPFLHAGSEFGRSKGGVENSYKSPDNINQINWELITKNKALVEDVKALIKIRKEYGVFNYGEAGKVQKGIRFLNTPQPNVIACELDGTLVDGKSEKVLVIANGGTETVLFPVDYGNLKPIYGNPKITPDGARIPAKTMVIFAK